MSALSKGTEETFTAAKSTAYILKRFRDIMKQFVSLQKRIMRALKQHGFFKESCPGNFFFYC